MGSAAQLKRREETTMAITGGFGMTMDLARGTMRQWVIGRDGVMRWADTNEPVVRGSNIKKNWFHDAGAYARCSHCGRYSDKPESLNKDEWPCECGKLHGWCGSFVAPAADSRWSEVTPNA
jgi:hypothetical protein